MQKNTSTSTDDSDSAEEDIDEDDDGMDVDVEAPTEFNDNEGDDGLEEDGEGGEENSDAEDEEEEDGDDDDDDDDEPVPDDLENKDDTAGKCHGCGLMAFDWRGTDTCHGVGTALHMRSKIGLGRRALYHHRLDSMLTADIHHSSPRAANTARTRTKLLTGNSNQSMRDCAESIHLFVLFGQRLPGFTWIQDRRPKDSQNTRPCCIVRSSCKDGAGVRSRRWEWDKGLRSARTGDSVDGFPHANVARLQCTDDRVDVVAPVHVSRKSARTAKQLRHRRPYVRSVASRAVLALSASTTHGVLYKTDTVRGKSRLRALEEQVMAMGGFGRGCRIGK
ncbi:hypothetical protein C8J57DRAFT_1245703 [Mycena rebaudengoi]|nr:hypothetical protein C8J57DRAFT_1245703 [Mycena rebaudengoi]